MADRTPVPARAGDRNPRTNHRNELAHWAPKDVTEHPYTACGRHIDGPCDRHAGTAAACQYGIAWTRGRDLEAFGRQPYMPKLTPCLECQKAATITLGFLE